MMNETEHLLTILGEECAEVVQVASKAIRFGLDSTNRGQSPEDNKRLIERELAEIVAVAEALGLRIRDEDKRAKLAKLKTFMAYSRDLGKLEVRES